MFATYSQVVFGAWPALVRHARRRPKSWMAFTLFFFAAAALAAFVWLHWHQWTALRLFELDLLPEAYEHQKAYLRQRSNDYSAQLLAARMARLLGYYSQAERHLKECMRLRGANEETQLEFLLMRAQGGELASVENGLTRYLEEEDHRVVVAEGLAHAFMKDIRYQSASLCLDKWLAVEPDAVRALSWRGWVRENLHRTTEALEDYRRALQLSPRHATTRLRLAQMHLAALKVPEAMAELQVLEELTPDHPEVLLALADCRVLRGQPEEARRFLERVLTIHPENARALYQLGKIEPDPVKREAWFRKALEADPSYHEAKYAMYVVLNQLPGRQAEAAAQLKSYEQSVKAWKGLRTTMQELERSPNDPDLLAKVGDTILSRDSTAGTYFLFKALAIAPNHRLANEAMVRYYTEQKQPERAANHRKRLAGSDAKQ